MESPKEVFITDVPIMPRKRSKSPPLAHSAPVEGITKKKLPNLLPEETISIDNFEEICNDDEPIFTEEATVMAMNKLGITPSMLKSSSEINAFSNDPATKERMEKAWNNRRIALINEIKRQRQELLNEKPKVITRSTSSYATLRRQEEDEMTAMLRAKIEQQKNIERIILSELQMEQKKKDKQTIDDRKEEAQRAHEKEVQEKRLADQERRKIKDDACMQKAAEREAERAEARKQTDIKAQRKDEIVKERQKEKLREVELVKEARLKKLEEQKQSMELRRSEYQQKVNERLERMYERDETMKEKRSQHLEILRAMNAEKAAKLKKKCEDTQKREAQKLEDRRTAMETKEEERDRTLRKQSRAREALTRERRARSQMVLIKQANHNALLKKKAEDKTKAYEERAWAEDERRALLLKLQQDKVAADRREREIKEKRVEEMQDRKKQERAEKRGQLEEKWVKETEYLEASRLEAQQESDRKASMRLFKNKLREDNAQIAENKRSYQLASLTDIIEERNQRAAEFLEQQKQSTTRRVDNRTRLEYEKAAIIGEFRDRVRRGDDIEMLAKEYNIDISRLRKQTTAKAPN